MPRFPQLRPEWLGGNEQDGFFIKIRGKVAKGGRERDVPLIGPEAKRAVEIITMALPGNRVFPKLHTAADIHTMRSRYVTEYYKSICRPVDKIPLRDRYICRSSGTNDPHRRGRILDRRALKVVSEACGHSRPGLIATAYLQLR